MSTPNRGTTFRLDADLRERLNAEAERDKRSANGELNVLLREALDAREGKRKDA
jgi:hypothetical protein